MGRKPDSEGSGASFEFPKNYFVWDFQKIDSRPYKSDPGLHFFFEHREISSRDLKVSGVVVLEGPKGSVGPEKVVGSGGQPSVGKT